MAGKQSMNQGVRNLIANTQKLTKIKFENLKCVFIQNNSLQNWSKLESLLRGISIKMNKVLRIFTGVYGQLAKRDRKGRMSGLYLDSFDSSKPGIEVPLIIWKLVIDTKTNDSIAFFTSNDTDMNKKEVAYFSTLCHSVCDKLGYNFNTVAKSGITLCCSYNEFIKHIRHLPIKLKSSNLLENTIRLSTKKSYGDNDISAAPAA